MVIYNIGRFMPYLVAALCCFLISNSSLAQSNTSVNHWTNFAKTQNAISAFPKNKAVENWLVALKEPVKFQDWKHSNAKILRVIDTKHLILSMDQESYDSHQHYFKKTWLANQNWKLSSNLLTQNKKHSSKRVKLLVEALDRNCIEQAFPNASSIKIQAAYKHIFFVEGPQQKIIDQLASLNCIYGISLESSKPKMESQVVRLDLTANKINLIKRYYSDLNGANKTISIKENLYDKSDLDLLGKDIPSATASENVNPHTTAMATIIAGNGNTSFNGKGVAEQAKLSSSDFSNLFPDNFEGTITLQNHSYGTEIENYYGILAREYDQSTFTNPEVLHVFSAGNQGALQAPEGNAYANVNGYANLTGNFKMAKNILTVGSINSIEELVYFSSRGPAYDGRIKPEIVCFSTEGTSNSAAIVTGVAALLQESYQATYNQNPPAALVKALLINAAKDIDKPGIDHRTGFGNLDAYRSLSNLQNDQFINGEIQNAEEISFPLTIPSNAKNLKITVVWADTPAQKNATKALVNDLDLQLLSPSSDTYLPWVLKTQADSSVLAELPTRAADHLNNIEQITIENPSAGIYQIIIKGYDIADSPLPFSIAYQWDDPVSNDFVWSFPSAIDNMPYDGESPSFFRWESKLSQEIGILEYSLDDGANWTIIEDSIQLNKSYHLWFVPEELEGIAIARMRVGNQSFPTEEFTISQVPVIEVGFDCGDSILLRWDNFSNTKYKIFKLQDFSMTAFDSTTNDYFIFNKADFEHNFFAVQPVYSTTKTGIRSVAIDYDLLSSGCYVNSFYLENVSSSGLNIHLDLGTNHGIDKIVFQRASAGSFADLGEINSPSAILLEYLDDSPMQGFNQYRAKIILNNGEEILTDIASAYFLTEVDFLVFPNPAPSELGFNVYSKDFSSENVSFELFGNDGRVLLSKNLTTDREFIETKGLSPGIYIYRLRSTDKVEIKKIVLR